MKPAFTILVAQNLFLNHKAILTTFQLHQRKRLLCSKYNNMTTSIFVVLTVILFAHLHIFVCTATTNLTVKQTQVTSSSHSKQNTKNQYKLGSIHHERLRKYKYSFCFILFSNSNCRNRVCKLCTANFWFHELVLSRYFSKNASKKCLAFSTHLFFSIT